MSQIVELRQYTLHPGARETLIELFDRELVESQEAVGMEVIGQFRDCDDPDRFGWLRGFRDMAARAQGLESFYGGPVWAEHRDAANATMIDSDDVLLLRPARATSGFPPPARDRPPAGHRGKRAGSRRRDRLPPRRASGRGLRQALRERSPPGARLEGRAAPRLSRHRGEPEQLPAAPVRDETVFAWVARVPDEEAFERHRGVRRSPARRTLLRHVDGDPEVLKLSPTARSLS